MTFDLANSPLAMFLPVLDGSLDPIGLVDTSGRYIWVNEAGARFFGFDREEVVGTHFRDYLLEEESPGDAMRRALMGNAAAVVRRVRRKDGSVAVLRTELIPVLDGVVLIHGTDLTILYETLDRVSESEGVLTRAQEIGRTAAWVRVVGEETVRWFAPPNWLPDIPRGGVTPRRVITDRLAHEDDRSIPQQVSAQAMTEGRGVGVFRADLGDGRIHWVRMSSEVVRDAETGEPVRVEGVLQDITEYREQDDRYRELLAAVRVPMLIWTPAQDDQPPAMLYVNDALCDLLGEPPSALLGRAPRDWIVPDEQGRIVDMMQTVMQGGSMEPTQIRIRRSDGEIRTGLVIASRVTFGGAHALCAQVIDVSEQIRLRELAARSRETDLALAVAAGVAHDFNNLLTGVLVYLDFAAAELSEDSPEGRYVAAARLAARRAANLAQALLGYSRSTAVLDDPDHPPTIDPTHVVDVTDVVREAYGVTRAAIDRKVMMVTHEGEAPAHAAIPADSLLRVLVNLLVNSRDAVLERAAGEDREYRPQIDLGVEAHPALRTLEITVADNGTGIPETVAEHIFEPYFTTKSARGGSGIGLRAARDLARAAGGELDFTSQPGVGTTFRLVLPLVDAPPSIDF
jgi:PAS domain S-box-containing protein